MFSIKLAIQMSSCSIQYDEQHDDHVHAYLLRIYVHASVHVYDAILHANVVIFISSLSDANFHDFLQLYGVCDDGAHVYDHEHQTSAFMFYKSIQVFG